MADGRQRHLAMLHTLGPDQIVCQLLDDGCLPSHRDDLQAIVVIQMAMEGGDDVFAVVVLKAGQMLL